MLLIIVNTVKLLYVIYQDKVLELLIDIEQYHQLFFPMLRCLDAVTNILPKHPLVRLVCIKLLAGLIYVGLNVLRFFEVIIICITIV